jgi:hypothetical protein
MIFFPIFEWFLFIVRKRPTKIIMQTDLQLNWQKRDGPIMATVKEL